MTKSKLKKYVGKKVKIHFRHTLRTEVGVIQYLPNEPLCDYLLYQGHCRSSYFYVALNPRMIGHIEILENQKFDKGV
jgi:hypothetical protein